MSVVKKGKKCPICGSHEQRLEEVRRGYELILCLRCKVSFTGNPDYRIDRYGSVYEGVSDEGLTDTGLYTYLSAGQRLRYETMAGVLPPPWLFPAEKIALRWLSRRLAKASLVLDIGCGTGRFLRAGQRAGFRMVGIEISEQTVRALRALGFDVRQGSAPTFDWREQPPDAITLFEVLEHLPDPVAVIKEIRQRFPAAALLASVPCPKRVDLKVRGHRGDADYPPNHYIRWSEKALRIAFEKAGYRKCNVVVPRPAGSEVLPGVGRLFGVIRHLSQGGRELEELPRSADLERTPTLDKKFIALAIVWGHWLYHIFGDVMGMPVARWYSKKGASSTSMLAIGVP